VFPNGETKIYLGDYTIDDNRLLTFGEEYEDELSLLMIPFVHCWFGEYEKPPVCHSYKDIKHFLYRTLFKYNNQFEVIEYSTFDEHNSLIAKKKIFPKVEKKKNPDGESLAELANPSGYSQETKQANYTKNDLDIGIFPFEMGIKLRIENKSNEEILFVIADVMLNDRHDNEHQLIPVEAFDNTSEIPSDFNQQPVKVGVGQAVEYIMVPIDKIELKETDKAAIQASIDGWIQIAEASDWWAEPLFIYTTKPANISLQFSYIRADGENHQGTAQCSYQLVKH
jgi:hypothetical protein